MQPKKKSGHGGKREGAGGPRNEVRQELEENFGVSARRIQQIIREIGIEKTADMGQLRLIEKKIVIALRSAQVKREEHQLAIAKRSVLPSDEVLRIGQQVGLTFSQGLSDLLSRLPAELAGCDEIKIYETLRRENAAIIDAVRRQVQKIAA